MPALDPATSPPAAVARPVEGSQPSPIDGRALCASLRDAARRLADPTTPPGTVATLLSQSRRHSIPPGLSVSGRLPTDPLIKEQ